MEGSRKQGNPIVVKNRKEAIILAEEKRNQKIFWKENKEMKYVQFVYCTTSGYYFHFGTASPIRNDIKDLKKGEGPP